MLIDDEMLQFTEAETKELVGLAGVVGGNLDLQVTQALKVSGGWPLALHSVVVGLRADPLTEPRLDTLFVTGVIDSFLGNVSDDVYDVALITGVVDEITPEVLARMAEISEERAGQMLRHLARTVLTQRFGHDGGRTYALQPILRDPIWRVPRKRGGTVHGSDRHRAVTMALRANHPEEALHAAFTSRDWSLIGELILHCTTESIIEPGGVLAGALKEIPEEIQDRYPLLRFSATLPTYVASRGQREAVVVRLQEISGLIDEAKSQHGPVYRFAALAGNLFAARAQSDDRQVAEQLALIEAQFEQLDESDIWRSWPTIATIANLAALTCLMTDELDASERWTHVVVSITPMRPARQYPVGRVHADAIAALVAAWRGDMWVAAKRVTEWEDNHSVERWGTHFVSTPYHLAKSIVALERGEIEAAFAGWRMLNEQSSTSDTKPYVVWLGVQVTLARYGAARAAGELRRAIRALYKSGTVMGAQRQMFDALAAQLMMRSGLGHPTPSGEQQPGLADGYAALDAGEFAGAAAITASVQADAAAKGFVRGEVEALLLRETAEIVLSGGDVADPHARNEFGDHARTLIEDYGIFVTGKNAAKVRNPASHGRRDPVSAQQPVTPVPKSILNPLTKGEMRALQSVAVNGNAVRAAAELQLSPHTVRDHLKSIYRKLEVPGRAEAVRVAYQLGMLTQPGMEQ